MKIRDVFRKQIAQGVALLKIDDDVRLQAGAAGNGYALLNSLTALWRHHVIVKAKLDDVYCDPRQLVGRKVFYRFYADADRFGKRRPYLHLCARSNDAPYWGKRVVILSADGAFLVPEPSWRERRSTERMNDLSLPEDAVLARIGLSFDEIIETHTRKLR